MSTDYDVVIVGAGVVGLTAALAVYQAAQSTHQRLKIAVIDAKAWVKTSCEAYDLRVASINPGSERILKQLGVWSLLQRRCAYQTVRVWDQATRAELQFNSSEVGQSHLGHIIEHKVLLNALHMRLQACGIVLLAPIALTQFKSSPEGVTVATETGQSYRTRLLIGADGAHSWVRQQCFSPLVEQPYAHHAIIATVQTERSHQATAWQCFLNSGPLAFLPLSNADGPHTCSIVWSAVPSVAEDLMAENETNFAARLTKRFAPHLGAVQLASHRVCIPLMRRHAQQYVTDGVVLLGDAAHTIHPLAGQGMNLGIADAAQLAKTLQTAWQARRRAFALHTLQRFARARKAHNQEMLWLMDGFQAAFSADGTAAHWLKQWGFGMVNRSTWLKQNFIRAASDV